VQILYLCTTLFELNIKTYRRIELRMSIYYAIDIKK